MPPARSSMLSLASRSAPAAHKRMTTIASRSMIRSLNGNAPRVVGILVVASKSLAPWGAVQRSPITSPLRSASALAACSRARSRVRLTTQWYFGPWVPVGSERTIDGGEVSRAQPGARDGQRREDKVDLVQRPILQQ